MIPEMKELIEKYAPHVIWSDGDWETLPEYWGSEDFLAWLYNESPSKDYIVTNDRSADFFYFGDQRLLFFNIKILQLLSTLSFKFLF